MGAKSKVQEVNGAKSLLQSRGCKVAVAKSRVQSRGCKVGGAKSKMQNRRCKVGKVRRRIRDPPFARGSLQGSDSEHFSSVNDAMESHVPHL